MFEIGQILTKENYTQAAIECNKLGDRHIEKQGGQYIIVAKSKPTEEELKKIRIDDLKKLLADTDYKAIKYAEGLITEEEYAETKAQRQAWREELNALGV